MQEGFKALGVLQGKFIDFLPKKEEENDLSLDRFAYIFEETKNLKDKHEKISENEVNVTSYNLFLKGIKNDNKFTLNLYKTDFKSTTVDQKTIVSDAKAKIIFTKIINL
ncbi:hypothetical protein SGLAD_v1c09510 [Spiroplasma gladiatoris]|uniref:Uncharacterized protein n=1 Tax=Spiroplasma gladiatoris TaxID=2143 RepID=A0A4P7AKR9_9MOLU|nr:hypothetical protein [Spiroplasma gladiatoris]QBQ08150.1 hypothetical protein SGLAD_v1c09510 [Spiroplasma gladiatoris]